MYHQQRNLHLSLIFVLPKALEQDINDEDQRPGALLTRHVM